MADYFSPTVVQPIIPNADMTPLERLLLMQIFESEPNGDGLYFFAEVSPEDQITLPIEALRAALAAADGVASETATFVLGHMKNVGEDVSDVEFDLSQVYPFASGALYQVYAAPGQVTDVALQEGEQLVGSGPVAAGDTVRWIIGDTESGTGPTKRIHILVKPTRPELVSNLVINTDRRTYLLELRSAQKTYMASVSWQYPQDQLIALRRQNESAEAATPIITGVDISRLRFRYAIEGDNPPRRPVSAFDDGSKVYIEMPAGIAQGEAPPLFVIGPEGDGQLVNYRVRQNYYIVDRLFAAAELRMGGEHQQTVRISRTDGRAR